MSFLKQEETTLINVRLTDVGRKLLAKGMKEGVDIFDIVKFSFGDSEIDYRYIDDIDNPGILSPTTSETDISSKIYFRGIKPVGDPTIIVSSSDVSLTTFQEGGLISVYTEWLPIVGKYVEEYKWLNLGPMEDWDFKINLSMDTSVATFRSYGVTGESKIKIIGLTSGRYETITLSIE